MLGNILKIFLLALVVVVVVGLVFWLVLAMGWAWWVGIFILFGLLGLVLCLLLLRKLLLRRREQRFVQQVIAQDEAYRNTLGDKEKEGSKELQDGWKEAITALRKSHLKKIRKSPLRPALVYGDRREWLGKNHGDSERPAVLAIRRNTAGIRH
jgi:type VI secretion system protein ImpL